MLLSGRLKCQRELRLSRDVDYLIEVGGRHAKFSGCDKHEVPMIALVGLKRKAAAALMVAKIIPIIHKAIVYRASFVWQCGRLVAIPRLNMGSMKGY
eukprot:scaffold127015_cov33-Prasinocladus_malaysianus.AAC.1